LINYIINGFLDCYYSLFAGCIIIVTTIIGLLVLNFLLEKLKKAAFMTLIMACIYIFAIVIVVDKIIKEFRTEVDLFKFKNYCDMNSYTK
jgi:chromate transport protein ChrA